MAGDRLVHDHPHHLTISRLVGIIVLLLLLACDIYLFSHPPQCIDGCGPYHDTTSVADLDGDGDLDVVLNNLRHETDTIVWAGATVWINQGGGMFTSRNPDLGGPSTAAGDLDGDGDPDLVQTTDTASLHLNQGGAQGGEPGDFVPWRSIAPQENSHNWASEGSVALGDLNNDGRLDAFFSYCCSNLMDGQEDIIPFIPWVWLNTPDANGLPAGPGLLLSSLGDLPMRATLGDLDGDGDLDAYAALLPPKSGGYDSADRILLNDGSGGFVDSGQRLANRRLAGTAASGAVALGDLDRDGDLDALVATSSGAALWINQGRLQGGQAGVFANSGLRLGRGYIEHVFLADLDADGDLDAVLGEKARPTVWFDSVTANGKAHASIWLNDGPAGFRDSMQRLPYTERFGLAVGDFNRDGYPDLLAVGDGYHLWLNQGNATLLEGN